MSYYDLIADRYDDARWMTAAAADEITSAIVTFVSADKAMKILELGAGTGVNTIPLVQQGYCVTAIDKSRPMLDILRAKAGTAQNLTVLNADASRLDFEERSFDVVLAANVLHSFRDIDALLGQIDHVVKLHGWFLSCQWLTPPSRHEFEREFLRLLGGGDTAAAPMQEIASCVSKAMRGRGYSEYNFTAHRWLVSDTVAELLGQLKYRPFGYCWSYPESVYDSALDQFTTLCVQRYGSMGHRFKSEASFDVWAYRKEH